MATAKSKWRVSPRTFDSERVLEEYYGKLQKWGIVLTRGDRTMAHEIVHDLCLHFVVAKPDLSQVANLDGYLYTCLRHIYLSALARSSREALQTVGVADFDSIQFAVSTHASGHLLERQNELRRVCNYAVWRKNTSKSASYFLLLFFHGYVRREAAEIARVPIPAIYNKLKVAREELKAHLATSSRMRIATREFPPDPKLRVSTVSTDELFQELRQRIFDSRPSECLPEETLLAQYEKAVANPIPCDLLSHIVSCGRCLSLLDRHFERPAWQDREPPGSTSGFDGGYGIGSDARGDGGYQAMISQVRRQRDRIYEHRPRTLSIAINGRIVAFHDVQSERSTLSSRADHPETVQFVEVFTDQQIRLALLPIEDFPPAGAHIHAQSVALSDSRWLELKLSLDGQGLHSEVTYLDPALPVEKMEEGQDEMMTALEPASVFQSLDAAGVRDKFRSIASRILRPLHANFHQFALALSVIAAAALGGAGYLAYRYTHPSLDARTILDDSVRAEAASSKGKAEHRILRLDALSDRGQTVWRGTVDEWQEPGGGRTLRRLFNAQHRLLAAAWQQKDGESGMYMAPTAENGNETDRQVATGAFWQVDVSASEFLALAARRINVRSAQGDYELTGTELSNAPPHFVSAMLMLNRQLHVVRETLHISGGYAFTEVRFVEASEVYLPAASVPDSVFDPSALESRPRGGHGDPLDRNQYADHLGETNSNLVQTEVAVLYRLSELGADIGEPLQVNRTPSGRIRVMGTVANEARIKQIDAALENVPEYRLLEIHLLPERGVHMPIPGSQLSVQPTNVYEVARVEPAAISILRKYFASNGLNERQVDSAVAKFSRDALDRAQRALQDAYALDRLGASFSAEELRAMGPVARQQWSAMVAQHSSALESELDQLHHQLAQLNPARERAPRGGQFTEIESPEKFAHTARRLLLKTQDLNRAVGSAFSSGPSSTAAQNANASIDAALEAIPLNGAEEMTAFATQLTHTNDAASHSAER